MLIYEVCGLCEYQVISDQTAVKNTQFQGKGNEALCFLRKTKVHWGTVYNSKDLEPTQVPINDRLDKENVAHIHHGILCSLKNDEFMFSAGT